MASVSKAKIKSVHAAARLDSRGYPTVEAIVTLENGTTCRALAPSGASTGSLEALELRDGGPKHGGKGVTRAVQNVNIIIARKLTGHSLASISDAEAIDMALCELDGNGNKSRLGANATTAVSMACYQAAANVSAAAAKGSKGEAASAKGAGVYSLMGGNTLPVPFLNVINGGKHAGSGLAVQEFMLAPIGFNSFSEALWAGADVYHALGELTVKQYGPSGKNVGDEGGYAPPIRTSAEALQLLEDAIDECGYSKKMKLACDAAADSFFSKNEGYYMVDDKERTPDEMIDYWAELTQVYPLISLEDPFEESDFNHFRELKARIGSKVQIVGDDLTVTNLKRVKKARDEQAISTLLLKVNQIGTVSEAVECAHFCQKHKMGVMVSHRSGETEDTFIADLAVGLNAGQIKTGAPARGERTAKYNRLLAIEEELGASAKFLGEKALVRN